MEMLSGSFSKKGFLRLNTRSTTNVVNLFRKSIKVIIVQKQRSLHNYGFQLLLKTLISQPGKN